MTLLLSSQPNSFILLRIFVALNFAAGQSNDSTLLQTLVARLESVLSN